MAHSMLTIFAVMERGYMMEVDGTFYLILEAEELEEHLDIIAEIDEALNSIDYIRGTKL